MADTTYTILRAQLLAKLQSITQIAEVEDDPKLEFDSFPGAVIIPAEGESDYETNVEDERIYAFDIILYETTKDQGISVALTKLYDAVDYVLDSFAQDRQLESPTPMTMPTGKTFLQVKPVAAGWGDIPDKELVAATIKIFCQVSVDNS